MKHLTTKSEAEGLLLPHVETVQRCLREGWEEWLRLRDRELERGNTYSPRARANIVYDLVAERARAAFDGVEGVAVLRKHGFLVLLFGGRIAMRFKKLRPDLKSTGIRTNQQRLFAEQEEMPGIPATATFLIAGYVLDPTQAQIDRLVVTCSDGLGICWVLDLDFARGRREVVSIGSAIEAPAPPEVRSARKKARAQKEGR